MVAGEVRGCFFQELVFHLQFPGLPFELAQPRALIHGERRLFTGMLTAVGGHPVTEGSFVDTELLCHSGDRARRLDHHLHGFILEFRREALLRSGQLLHLSRRPSYWMDCPEASGHLTAASWDEAGVEDVARFVAWLRAPAGNVIVLAGGTGVREPATVNRYLAGVFGFYDHHARTGLRVAAELVSWRRISRGSYKPFLHYVTKGRPIPVRPVKLHVPPRAPRTLEAEQIGR